jgi:uncharacterized protein (DUF58 family)
VLISDLSGVVEDEARAIRAIARLRKAAGTIIVIVPDMQAFLPAAATPHARRVRDLVAREQRAAVEPGRKLLARHGITVIQGSPADSLERLLGARGATAVRSFGHPLAAG